MSTSRRRTFEDPAVAKAFLAYPPRVRRRLERLRALVLSTAAATEGVGSLQETLKWGQPAYVTAESRSGTTIRLGWTPERPDHYTLLVHCQTRLIATFRRRFGCGLRFEGNRAVVFDVGARVPTRTVTACIRLALRYHLDARRRRARGEGRASSGSAAH